MSKETSTKKNKARRIMAIVGIMILISLYVVTLVAAIMNKPYADKFFIASLYSSIIIPVLIYGFMVVTKAFGRKEGELSLRQLKQIKRDIKNMPEESEQESNQLEKRHKGES